MHSITSSDFCDIKRRVEKTEITGGTLSNFVKTIKLFCEMTEIPIHWKKIPENFPNQENMHMTRAPTIDIIRQNIICNSGKYLGSPRKCTIFEILSS